MIEDLTAHLANITILLEYFEKNGGTRNRWVVAEFESCNARLIAALKEKHDARTSETRRLGRDEGRTELPSSLAGRGGPARPEGEQGAGGDTVVRRPGA